MVAARCEEARSDGFVPAALALWSNRGGIDRLAPDAGLERDVGGRAGDVVGAIVGLCKPVETESARAGAG